MKPKTVLASLAQTIVAYHNCVKSENSLWRLKWDDAPDCSAPLSGGAE